MSKEIKDLVDLYFEKLNAHQVNIYAKRNVFKDIENLVSKGVEKTAIERAIIEDPLAYKERFKEKKKTRPSRLAKVREDTNLINGRFHYHPFTQESPGPPVLHQNPDGSFTESYSNEEFYLRIKNRLSLRDILEYLYMRFPYAIRNDTRDMGGIKHVYNNRLIPYVESLNMDISETDLILFTIDEASRITLDKDIKLRVPLLDITSYLEDGLNLYLDKV
jgi:hypothetical protein